MLQENQLHAESNNGSDNSAHPVTTPYRHRGYKKALYALRDALDNHGAVILKGVEGTGKTTLVSELISDYQHKGVPVVRLDTALTKPSQFYAELAECLQVPKQKKDLIQALRDTKAAGQYCLVVIDQEAIDSSVDVADALKQLCLTSETTAGAIKLIVVRKDYLVIHTGKTPEADFHNWIKTEVTLDPLQTDDIEGYIYYLSAIKGLPPTPYEIGTDFLMIEQTEGRISRLKALLPPLIHKDVITRKDFVSSEHGNKPLHANHSGMIALAFALILALGVGINHFLFQNEPAEAVAASTTTSSVFAEAAPTASGTAAPNDVSVTPPSVSKDAPKASNTIAATSDVTDTSPNTPAETIAAKPAAPISADAFQTEVKIKLLQLETELTEAKIENNRLQMALIEARKQQATPKTQAVPAKADDKFVEAVMTAEAQNAVKNVEASSAEDRSTQDTQTVASNATPAPTLAETPQTGDVQQEQQAPAPSAAQNKTATVAVEQSPLTEATALIDRWQHAWQAQNHEDYIFTYTATFNGAYKTHQRWLKQRHTALTTPEWIKLERGPFMNIQQTDSMVSVDFWISYEAANGYKDKTRKRLIIKNVDGEWLISKERNLEVQPLL